MKNIVYFISAIFLSITPLIASTLIGFFIYISFSNITGFVIIGVIIISSFWLTTRIFRKVRKIGPIEFLTAISASSDLDNLKDPAKDTIHEKGNADKDEN